MTYMSLLNCALKLVEEIILYYDARSKKHQIAEPLFTYCNDAGSRFLCDTGTHVPDLTASCSTNHHRDSTKPQCMSVTIRIHIKIRVQEISFIHLHCLFFELVTTQRRLQGRRVLMYVYHEQCFM